MNMDQEPHSYRVHIEGNEQLQYVGKQEVSLASGEYLTLPIQLQIDPVELTRSNINVQFHIEAIDDSDIHAEAESRFIGPTPMPGASGTSR